MSSSPSDPTGESQRFTQPAYRTTERGSRTATAMVASGSSARGAPWSYGSGQPNRVYIVDVDGTRQVIDTMHLPGTSDANLAELEQILASIRFEP